MSGRYVLCPNDSAFHRQYSSRFSNLHAAHDGSLGAGQVATASVSHILSFDRLHQALYFLFVRYRKLFTCEKLSENPPLSDTEHRSSSPRMDVFRGQDVLRFQDVLHARDILWNFQTAFEETSIERNYESDRSAIYRDNQWEQAVYHSRLSTGL